MSITIEYREDHVRGGDVATYKTKAPSGVRVQVLEVRQIGDEMRYSYVVIRGE